MQANPGPNSDLDRSDLDQTGPLRLEVEVQCAEGIARPADFDLELFADRAFSILCNQGVADEFLARAGVARTAELCVRLVDESEGQALNRDWRGKSEPTNVLSFTADIVAGELAQLGDLVLCMPVVSLEAIEQTKAERDHVAHLLVHGILHLLGYDHVDEAEAVAMEAIEISVLEELGVVNPYG